MAAARAALVALGGNGNRAVPAARCRFIMRAQSQPSALMPTAILAQSIGGGGGNAGSTRARGRELGGTGSGGGNGAAVQVFNSGVFSATGSNSFGIFAQSIGGGGGNGGGGNRDWWCSGGAGGIAQPE